jgi:hypothetical protein
VVAGGLAFLINIFNGFVISYPVMPIYWKWLNRLAPPTWMLYGLAASQLGNLGVDVVLVDGTTQPVRQYLIDTYDYDYDFRWYCLLILAGFFVFCRVTSTLALRYLNFLKR